MNKRTIALIAVVIAISAAYDFYRGYHHTRSIVGGIIVAVFGLLFLAWLIWMFSNHRNTDK